MSEFMEYKAFVETAKTGSLTAAAGTLNYTQPGISRLIRLFEEECGFPLFFRNKQGVTLSENGQHIYNLCQDILECQNALNNTIQQLSGAVIGTLRIGSYLSVLMNWMPSVLSTLSVAYPQLELQLAEGNKEEQLALLEQNAIDIAIFSSHAPESYKFIPVCHDSAVAVLPRNHVLCEKEVITNQDLLSYPLLAQPESASELLKNVLGEQFISVKRKCVVKSDQTLLRLVESGLGIGVVARLVVRPSDDVVIKPLEHAYNRCIGLAIPKWRPASPAVNAFVETVCSLYREKESQ